MSPTSYRTAPPRVVGPITLRPGVRAGNPPLWRLHATPQRGSTPRAVRASSSWGPVRPRWVHERAGADVAPGPGEGVGGDVADAAAEGERPVDDAGGGLVETHPGRLHRAEHRLRLRQRGLVGRVGGVVLVDQPGGAVDGGPHRGQIGDVLAKAHDSVRSASVAAARHAAPTALRGGRPRRCRVTQRGRHRRPGSARTGRAPGARRESVVQVAGAARCSARRRGACSADRRALSAHRRRARSGSARPRNRSRPLEVLGGERPVAVVARRRRGEVAGQPLGRSDISAPALVSARSIGRTIAGGGSVRARRS
jgi:hypothetical protein